MSKNKLLICLTALIIVFTFILNANAVLRFEGYEDETNYSEYLDKHQDKPRPEREMKKWAFNYTDDSTLPVEISDDIEGSKKPSLVIPERDPDREERGFVEWEFEVEEAGLYNIEMKYYPLESRGATIERDLWINGQRPFKGAKTLEFSRMWQDKTSIMVDGMGNHIRPEQGEVFQWRTVTLSDALGYHVKPYQFYLEEGKNTIQMYSLSEPMALEYIKIYNKEDPPQYADIIQEFEEKGYKETEGIFKKIQGQNAKIKSSNTLSAKHDMGDPTVEPYHPAQVRLNTFGGVPWRRAGQWVTWEFEVPEDGLYNITFKAKQDQERGVASHRKILIDGEVPYSDLSAVPFMYSSSFRNRTLGEEVYGKPYLFYLEKGTHTISMEVVLGEIAQYISELETQLYEMNTIYRRIIMITSPTPDPLRDYQLAERIPGIIDTLGEQAEIFANIADAVQKSSEQTGEQIAVLREIARLLRKMHDQPYKIPDVLGEYRDNIGAVGNWIYRMRMQSLSVDYFMVHSPGEDLPRAKPTFIDQLQHEARAFISSFTFDYSQIGAGQIEYLDSEESKGEDGEQDEGEDQEDQIEEVKTKEPLNVWVGTGRDQAQLLKQMVEDSFTPNTGIPVKIELITRMGNILIPATVAGTAPDVAVGAARMRMAFRGAIHDLTEFDDFYEVVERFRPSSLVPFRFRDNVYALPEMQAFAVLFYRRDILQELGLEIPKTWTDIYEVLPVLQRHNMNVGLRPDVGTMMMFLYQKGISIFEPDMVATNLDSETSIRTFEEMTNLYTLYNLPIQFNIQNRFRMGEMPLVISRYPLYQNLQVFAPELRGEWGFTLIPGHRREDGNVYHTAPVTGTPQPAALAPGGGGQQSMSVQGLAGSGTSGSIILNNSEMKEEAWEFLKWFSSADIQARFGIELEALMGEAGRYATANTEALNMLPWPPDLREELNEQWRWTEGIPPVPGGYYVSRQFNWLYRAVVLQNEPVREAVQDYTRRADRELERKRIEFGYATDIQDVDEKWIRMYWDQFSYIDKLELDEFKRRR